MTRLIAQACVVALLLSAALLPDTVRGHAFPIRSEPKVGSTIGASPPRVMIWFDGKLEPAFSTIALYNSAKQQVDKGNARVNATDPTVLEVDLPPLAPGKYRVYWSVVAVDGHRTEGDFPFTIERKPP